MFIVILILIGAVAVVGIGMIVAQVVGTIARRLLREGGVSMFSVRAGGVGGAVSGGFVGCFLSEYWWIPVQASPHAVVPQLISLITSSFVGMVAGAIVLAVVGAYIGPPKRQ